MGEILFIASGKGGTGKSAVAVNMGATLAQAGKKVVLLDMDFGQGTLDLYLGMQNKAVYNIYDVITGVCDVRQAMIRDKRFRCMYLMAAPPHADDGSLTSEILESLLSVLKRNFDYVIVDGPTGISDNMVKASTAADLALIVTTPDYAGLRGAEVADMVLMKNGIKERYYVLNRMDSEHTTNMGYPSMEEIARIMRGRVAGIIHEDRELDVSLNRGMPTVIDSRSSFAENILQIAKRIVG